MLSKRQTINFAHYLRVTPKAMLGKAPGSVGAYDSRRGTHGFSRGLSMREFDFGGAFDYVGEADGSSVTKALKFLAAKLSAEDWAEFQRALCGEQGAGAQDLTAEQLTDPKIVEKVYGKAMDSADARRRVTSKGSAGFAALFPDAAPLLHV